ncbi:hypothetical protein [Lysinibacillus pakistanensis]|uniref:hypothetical protein n=1 Tax=Lysinibacillus pakistanensis TaxID=759811 RepID=UPI0028AD4FCB|nr:hypothetical protein [Lysinibacillus pakistanensis]
MWKVDLDIDITNKYEVYKFTDDFVKELLRWAVQNRNIKTYDGILKSNIKNRLLRMVKYNAANRDGKFIKGMITLSCCKKIERVLRNFIFYTKNYRLILLGKLRKPEILDKRTLKEIKEFFRYLYSSMLDEEYFWRIYNPSKTYKSKKMIREEQGENRICPYCDQHSIGSSALSNIDHFLPISEFPFLSIHWSNLIVSCISCNGITIKHTNWHIPILHPYYDKIENVLLFKFKNNEQLIEVCVQDDLKRIKKGKKRGENFIKLFKYEKLYKGAWIEVESERDYLEKTLRLNYLKKGKPTLIDNVAIDILRKTVDERKIELNKKKGKQGFVKLKFDYGKEYLNREGYEFIEWLKVEKNSVPF